LINGDIIYTRHAVRLYWVPGHAGVRGNEIANELARGGSAMGFLGPKPAMGISRQDIQKKLSRGWSTSTGQVGRALVTPKDMPKNQSPDPVWVPGPNFCPSIGHNPGL